MSDQILSYATPPPQRSSAAGALSIWLAAIGDALFLFALLAYQWVAKPALVAGLNSYHWKKMWFTVVPAWVGMALGLAAVSFGIAGFLIPGRSRLRSAVGLGLVVVMLFLMSAPL